MNNDYETQNILDLDGVRSTPGINEDFGIFVTHLDSGNKIFVLNVAKKGLNDKSIEVYMIDTLNDNI